MENFSPKFSNECFFCYYLDRRDSTTSSSRTLAPVAFFHDGFTIDKTDLQKNFMGAQRRAQAIATAPRRKRYDDDNEEEDDADHDDNNNQQKKSRKIFHTNLSSILSLIKSLALLGYIKTSSLPIPISNESEHPHSLPQIQSGTNLLPTFRVDPPTQDNYEQYDYTFHQNFRRIRCPSAPLPSENEDWKN